MPTVDHVTFVTPDAARFAADLRERHGLGSERNGYHPHLGTRSWSVPLAPPTYIEFLEVEDESVAAPTPLGQRVLALRDAGGGPIAWSLLVDDIDEVAARTGIAPYEGRTEGPYGTLHWRTVTGPDHLPFFIVYEGDVDARTERLHARYERVAHACAPTVLTAIDVAGPHDEYDAWLGPHDLPLRYVDGPPGLRSVTFATDRGDVVLG
jgi:hypothetical protein